MKELGYVVTKRCSKEIPNFVGCVHSVEEITDPTKPYLLIGYKQAKEVLGDKFNILDKRLGEKAFWTFSKTEKRTDFEKDQQKFYDYIVDSTLENLKYYYINIFTLPFKKKKKLIEILQSNETKYIYICGDMIYIYYNNYVMGVSLKMCKYCRLDVKKIIQRLHSNKSNIIYTNDSFLDDKLKEAIENKIYAVAYFMSLKE